MVDLNGSVPVSLGGEHVDYAITEYGIAALRGLSSSQRAQALIAIAHPEHREQLRQQVKERFA